MLAKALCVVALVPVLLPAQKDWDEPFPPHKIAGNLYYVGSRGLSTYLITTSQGHILINSSFERTVPLIRTSVEKLGFKFSDVKILLGSHSHNDHVEGHALIQELTGARIFVMQGDDKAITSGGEQGQYLYKAKWKPARVSRVLKDGEKVTLGDTTLTAVLTPGHTPGNTTWTMQVKEGDKTYNVVIVGSPNVNTGYQLVKNAEYPKIAEDFAQTFRVLKALPCDIFLGAHGMYYDLEHKYRRVREGAKENPFIDPKGYQAYIAEREQNYKNILAGQSR